MACSDHVERARQPLSCACLPAEVASSSPLLGPSSAHTTYIIRATTLEAQESEDLGFPPVGSRSARGLALQPAKPSEAETIHRVAGIRVVASGGPPERSCDFVPVDVPHIETPEPLGPVGIEE